MSKILIIDDDKDVLFAAEQYLQKNNEDVFTATGGSQGLRVLKQETIDCIVLDVLLKGESGFDLCRKIRSFSSVPIVFLTNLSSQEDLKNGFLMGADDYITKPFSLEELYLRIQARIRQYYQIPSRQKILNFFPLRINLDARTIQIQDNRVPLTMSEFDILVLLAQTPEHVYTISEIYQRVWNPHIQCRYISPIFVKSWRRPGGIICLFRPSGARAISSWNHLFQDEKTSCTFQKQTRCFNLAVVIYCGLDMETKRCAYIKYS